MHSIQNDTDLVCPCVLQWGFHSQRISADLKTSWTTHATSTSTQRRGSQWEYGGSLVDSLCVHSSASAPEKYMNTCIFGTGGPRVEGTLRIRQHRTTWEATVYVERQVCLSLMLSLSLPLSQAYTPCQPMGRRRGEKPRVAPGDPGRWQSCYYLSPWKRRNQVGWEWRGRNPWIEPNRV